MDFLKLILTTPFIPENSEIFGVIALLWWAFAIALMIILHGDWRDFLTYLLWSIAIGIGLAFFIVPGLIILAIFLWRYGPINIIAILLGPVGWAIGSSQGWLD